MSVAQKAQAILDFWFELPAEAWFKRDVLLDAQIRSRFAETVTQAKKGELDAWTQTAKGRLALIILLDQFTRNLYRNDPEAFASDAAAQKICIEGLDKNDDAQLQPVERIFFVLPLEHAEDLEKQQRLVAYLEKLAASVPQQDEEAFATYLQYGRAHRDVIAKFGRFPHRNMVLGRQNTAAETEYLSKPGAGF